MTEALIITFAALLTALATELGAIPLAFERISSHAMAASANAVAAGLMLSASAALVLAGIDAAPLPMLAGCLVGIAMVVVVHQLLDMQPDDALLRLRGRGTRAGLLIMLVMTVHSFAEGIGIGVSFAQGGELGLAISIAMAVHNIPEGLAISLVLVPAGVSVRRAAAWSILSSIPQPLAALPAFLFVEQFAPLLPAGLGFAAGAMLALVVIDIVPGAVAGRGPAHAARVGGAAFIAMSVFQLLLRA